MGEAQQFGSQRLVLPKTQEWAKWHRNKELEKADHVPLSHRQGEKISKTVLEGCSPGRGSKSKSKLTLLCHQGQTQNEKESNEALAQFPQKRATDINRVK